VLMTTCPQTAERPQSSAHAEKGSPYGAPGPVLE
jgi:hypothetical protein